MSCEIDAVLVSESYCSRPGTYVWPHGTPRMLCAVHYREMCLGAAHHVLSLPQRSYSAAVTAWNLLQSRQTHEEEAASLRSRIAALEEERDALKKANEELHDAIRLVKDDYANERAGRFEREKRVVELKQEVDHFRCRLSEETKRSRLYLKALEKIATECEYGVRPTVVGAT